MKQELIMIEIRGCDESQLNYTDKLQRKVLIIAKSLILLHMIVSTLLLVYFRYIFIAWIPFIIPFILFYNGARKKKRIFLIPFIFVITIFQAIFIGSTPFLFFYLTLFLNSTFNMNFEGVAVFLLAIAILGIANILMLWILKTTNKFYDTLSIEESSGSTLEQCDLNNTQQRPIPSAPVDIDRCQSCGVDNNPLEISVIHPSTRGDQMIETSNLQHSVDLIEERSSINEDSSESKQDLPPTYKEIISSDQKTSCVLHQLIEMQ